MLQYETHEIFIGWGLSCLTFIAASRLPSSRVLHAIGLFLWAIFYFVLKISSEQWVVLFTSTVSGFGAGLLVKRRPPSALGWLLGSFYFGVLFPVYITQAEYLTLPLILLAYLITDRPALQPFFRGAGEVVGCALVYPLTHTREVGWLSFGLGTAVGVLGRRVPRQKYVSLNLAAVTVAVFWLVDGDESEAAYFSALGVLFAMTSQGVVWLPCLVIGVGWLIPVHWLGCALMGCAVFLTQFWMMGQSMTLAERCKEKSNETSQRLRRVLRVWNLRSIERERFLNLAAESQGELRMTYLTRAAILERQMEFFSAEYQKLQELRHRFDRMQFGAENAESKVEELQIVRELELVLKTSELHACEIEVRSPVTGEFEVNMESVLSERLDRLQLNRDVSQSERNTYEFV